jgi:hypothetical protein
MLREHSLRVLRKIFGQKGEKIKEEIRENCLMICLVIFCSSTNIIGAMKSRRSVRCAGHMGKICIQDFCGEM